MKIRGYLEESPIFHSIGIFDRIHGKASQKLEAHQLSVLQSLLLIAIFFEDKTRATPSQLADVFETSRATMSQNLNHLVGKRLLKRDLNPDDSRSYIISLTSEGKKKAVQLIRLFDSWQSSFERQVGASELKRAIGAWMRLSLG